MKHRPFLIAFGAILGTLSYRYYMSAVPAFDPALALFVGFIFYCLAQLFLPEEK